MIRWKRADPVGALRAKEQVAKHKTLYVAIPHFINGPEKLITRCEYKNGVLVPLTDMYGGTSPRFSYSWRLHDMNVDSDFEYNDNLVFANYWHAWAYAQVCGELYKS